MINIAKIGRALRVRYAPSPTGRMHLGGLRTALYNKLFVGSQGKFILRIEDTDQKRLVNESIDDIHQTLTWANLQPDEGPWTTNQPYGPYIQSERLKIYKDYVEKLIEKGQAYKCYCSPERIEEVHEKQKKNKEIAKYDGKCRQTKENHSGPYVIRYKNNCNGISFLDGIYGQVTCGSEHFDDFILVKSDGWPTYHLANVVDDIEMQISHVIRGQQWLTSTPKHLLLYNCFNCVPPQFIHLPLILSTSGSKLSKRDNSTSVVWYRDEGYEKEAVIQGISLLGWTPPSSQLLTMKQLAQSFDIFKVHKAPATFDLKKMNALNRKWLKHKYKHLAEFREALKPLQIPDDKLALLAEICLDRVSKITEIKSQFSYLFDEPCFTTEESKKDHARLFQKDNKQAISSLLEHIAQNDITEQAVKNSIDRVSGTHEGNVHHLLRFCLSGRSSGPSTQKIAVFLGKQKILQRLSRWL